MNTLTKHQRRLVLLVVLVLVLISAPAIIMTVSSPRQVPAVAQLPATQVSQAPTSRSIDIVTDEAKPEQESPREDKRAQVEPTSKLDNRIVSETGVSEEQIAEEGNAPLGEHARGFVAGNWVVVDCEQRVVLQCPHKLIKPGLSPGLNPKGGGKAWQGHCRDVSIKFDSFCRN